MSYYHMGAAPFAGGHHGRDETAGKIYDSRVIARLPPYLAPVKGWLGVAAGGVLVRSAAQLTVPYLVAVATDRFIQAGDFAGLNVIVAIFVGMSLLIWGGSYLETRFLAYAGQSVLFRMRNEMFDHLQKLSLSYFDRNKVGTIMSRVQNDVSQLQEMLTQGILTIITSFLTLVGIAVVMIILNAKLALLTLTVVPVLGLVLFVWQRYARRAFLRVRQAIAVVNAQLQESIAGIRVTQSLSREDENFRQFDSANRAHLDANIEAVRLQAFMMPTVQVLTAAAYGLVIVFGGFQVLEGTLGAGVLVGFLLYIQRFFDPVLELTIMYTDLQRSMASGARIFELLDIKPEIIDREKAIELPRVRGEVKFDRVSFSYLPGVEVLHEVTLTVLPGETLAIVGPTGAGKSSLMNLATRLYEATKGEVTIDDYNVKDVTQASLRRQIGIVPQDPFLFSGTIEDNIRYGHLEADHEAVVKAATIAGAHAFIKNLERGYETPVGERGGNLSAGERQLICLARAILSDPPILILDEATSSVDTETERIMQASLGRLAGKRTCLIIAHRLSTVTGADRIVVLEKGKIAETGNHRELLAKKGLYYQMFEALRRSESV
ncbi:MAG: ABC transporter ATP-binding protein [Dehalococcoidia bacterium]|jgi:ATP-binding cassette subfamily B protein|nr:MAG: ABC transporter ATP-binding protein [Dehalococcoidia bacterium]